MKKEERIKNKREFDNMIKTSQYQKNSFFVVYYTPKKAQYSRFGIAVGTKIGNAVIRNGLKRKVREIIRDIRSDFKNTYDYIIIVRKPCLCIKYTEMKENLIRLIKKMEKK